MHSEVRFSEVQKLLEQLGFKLVRITGSHHIFGKPGHRPISIPVHHGKVKYVYVRQIKKKSKAIDRPFDPAVLKQAKAIAERYQIVLWFEEGEYYGRGLELPLVMSDGKTPDQCVANTREALVAAVAYMIEEGTNPPAPASDTNRSVQLNIRLTASEKSILEQAAQRNGFRGISDYVRHAALTHGGN